MYLKFIILGCLGIWVPTGTVAIFLIFANFKDFSENDGEPVLIQWIYFGIEAILE